ncbi:MAG TPA: ester cyclase [Thermoleophilia bacterium]|nr:ester cyclase [Thermoleophilia bacterium]
MSESDKRSLRRIPLEVLNEGRFEVIDEVFSPDYIEHSPFPGYPATAAGIKSFLRDFRSAVPDLRYTVDHEISEGDFVVQHVTGTGTPQREFLGMPATGKSATWPEIHVVRVSQGKAVEHWGLVDMLGVMQQLGALPAQARAA